jgi:hypothetical protein
MQSSAFFVERWIVIGLMTGHHGIGQHCVVMIGRPTDYWLLTLHSISWDTMAERLATLPKRFQVGTKLLNS